MSKATMTVEGFVAKTPELGDHQGRAFTNVTVPHTPRRKNRQSGEWEDAGPTTWVQASFWEQDAQAVVQAVQKGTLVTITGQPEIDVYQQADGSKAVVPFTVVPGSVCADGHAWLPDGTCTRCEARKESA